MPQIRSIPKSIVITSAILLVVAFFFFTFTHFLFSWESIPTGIERAVEHSLASTGLNVKIGELQPGRGSSFILSDVELALPEGEAKAQIPELVVYFSWLDLLRNLTQPQRALSGIKLVQPELDLDVAGVRSLALPELSEDGEQGGLSSRLVIQIDGGKLSLTGLPDDMVDSPQMQQVWTALGLPSGDSLTISDLGLKLLWSESGRWSALAELDPPGDEMTNLQIQAQGERADKWSAKLSTDNTSVSGLAKLARDYRPDLRLESGSVSATAYLGVAGDTPLNWSLDLWLHRIDGSMTSVGLDVSGLQGGIKVTPKQIQLTGVRGYLGDDQVQISGSMEPALDGSLNLDFSSNGIHLAEHKGLLAKLYPALAVRDLQGSAEVALNVTGTLAQPLLAGSINLQDLGFVANQPLPLEVSALSGELLLAGQRVWTKGINLRLAEEPLALKGQVLLGKDPYFDLDLSTQTVGLDRVVAWFDQHGFSRLVPSWVRRDPPLVGNLSFSGTMLGNLEAPLVAGELNLQQGRVAGVPVESLRAEFDYSAQVFNLSRVDLALPQGQNLTGSIKIAPDQNGVSTYSGLFRYRELSAEWLAQYLPALPWDLAQVGGKASGELVAQGNFTSLPQILVGNIRLAQPSLANGLLSQFKADWSLEGETLDLQYFEGISSAGSFSGSGRLNLDDQSLSGQVFGHELEIADLASQLQKAGLEISQAQDFAGRASAQVEIGGSLKAPELSGKLLVTEPSWRHERFDLLTADFTYRDDIISLQKGELTQGVARVLLSGQINKVSTAPEVFFNTTVQELDGSRIAAFLERELPLDGVFDADLALSGKWPDLVLKGGITLQQGNLMGQELPEAKTQIFWNREILEFTDFSAVLAGARIKGNGELAAGQIQAALRADEVDLQTLGEFIPELTGAQGHGSFAGVITGDWREPVITGTVAMKDLLYQDYHLDGIAGKISYQMATGQVELDSLRFYQAESIIKAKGLVELAHGPGYDLNLDITKATLADLRQIAPNLAWPELDGSFGGYLQIKGEGKNAIARTVVDWERLEYRGLVYSAHLDLAYQDGTFRLYQGRVWDKAGEVVGSGSYQIGGVLDISAQGKGIALEPIVSQFSPNLNLAGSMDFALQAQGELDDPQVEVGFSIEDGMAQEVKLEACTGQAVVTREGITLQELAINTGENSTTVKGTIPWGREVAAKLPFLADTSQGMNLRVQMSDESLALLGLIVGRPLDIKGQGRVDLSITGGFANPVVNGEVDLAGLHFAMPEVIPGSFDQVDAKIVFQGRQGVIRQAQGLYNGGRFQADGKLDFAKLDAAEVDLRLHTSGVRMQFSFMDSKVDADLTLNGLITEPLIKGKATLNDAVFRFAQGKKGSGKPSTSEVKLDIDLVNGNDVRILVADIVDARAIGEMNLGGTIKAPTLTGHAEATRGTITYFDTVFQMTTGTADFASFRGVIPVLDVQAETRVPDATIGLGVTGPANDLQLQLTSNPPMSEQEIITKLTLPGRLSQLIQNGRDGAWEEELIRLFDDELSSQVMGGIESVVRRALQLDEFRIRKAFSEENVQLQFGKYLVNNLYVTYTRTLDTEDPLEYLGFEYRIKPNIIFNNSISSDGELRLGLETKFRF